MEEKEKRVVRKTFRLTPEEAEKLSLDAACERMSESKYIRFKVFGQDRRRIPGEVMEKLEELNYLNRKIGTNINQVAHLCNAKKQVADFDYRNLLKNQIELEKKTDEIFKFLKEGFLKWQ